MDKKETMREKKSYLDVTKNMMDILLKNINDSHLLKNDIMDVLKEAQYILEQVDNLNTRFCIESSKYGLSIDYSDKKDIWKIEEVYYFYFFVTIVGFIDAKINDAKRNIEFNSEFEKEINYDSQVRCNLINLEKDFIASALLDREEVVSDYSNMNNKNSVYRDLFLDVISTQPSYKKFIDLYDDSSENISDLFIHQQFVNAYNIGYINSNEEYDVMIEKYRRLLNKLLRHFEGNIDLLEREKGIQKTKIKKAGDLDE